MSRPQPGPSTSTSAASLKRQLSPDLVAAPGTSKQTSRRPTKRSKAASEIPQPINATQGAARTLPISPTKAVKVRVAAAASDRTPESGEQSRPGIQPVIITPPSTTQPAPNFSGNFDLYGMYLPFLVKLALPQGATTPDYPAVYDRILASQARHDYTARCFLAPHDASSSAPPHGRFESVVVLDPMAERPLDVTLNCFTYKKSLTFTPTERSSFQVPEHSNPGPGLVGHAGLSPVCGIKSARGVFKIRRIWTREQDGLVKELFEGFFSFGICYDSLYRKAGHGNGAKYKFAFWGVRALKDNMGKEIGLGRRQADI